jgi:hypothetical protein
MGHLPSAINREPYGVVKAMIASIPHAQRYHEQAMASATSWVVSKMFEKKD